MPVTKRANAPLTLSSFTQLRALAHPLRYRAFECLIDTARTGKQLALALGKQPTHFYHHLGVLERAGLIRQVATRKLRGTTEKYYQAVSDRVVVDEHLFGRKVVAKHAIISQVLRVTHDELVEAQQMAGKRSPKPALMVKRLRIRASEKRIEHLQRRLEAWLDDFESASDPRAEGEYAVTVAFYRLVNLRP